MSSSSQMELQNQLIGHIRNIPDFPKPGIVFRDITPLLANADALELTLHQMAHPFADQEVDIVIGAESRGFIFGTSMARQLNAGFVPVRKKGKLPYETLSESYELEYGTDSLEIHADAIKPGQRVLLVDDLLATGGTMQACCNMVQKLQGTVVGIIFLIELSFLNGRDKLSDYPVHSLIKYDAE